MRPQSPPGHKNRFEAEEATLCDETRTQRRRGGRRPSNVERLRQQTRRELVVVGEKFSPAEVFFKIWCQRCYKTVFSSSSNKLERLPRL